MANAPRGREKNVTGQGNGVYRRGEGLGTGQVGGGSFMGGAPTGNGGSAPQRSGGGGKLKLIIILAILFIAGGGGGLSLFGGSGSDSYTDTNGASSGYTSSGIDLTGGGSSSSSSGSSILNMLMGSGQLSSVSGASTGWTLENNTGKLNREVSPEARSKYTTLRGNGRDVVTIMVYMCGTDLESRSGMATNDLNEMAKATILTM